MVCMLHKTLYGLKHAPRAWSAKFQSALLSFGFSFGESDQSLFTRITSQRIIYLLVYVDKILIIGDDLHAITSLIRDLNKKFTLKDLGQLSYFLGIHVTSLSDGALHLSQ